MTIKCEFPLTEAKKHFPEIVRHVEAARVEVRLMRHGKPVAKIVPVDPVSTVDVNLPDWASELRRLHAEYILAQP